MARRLIIAAMFVMAMSYPLATRAQTSFYTDKALQQVNVLTSPTPLTAAIPYGSVRVCSLPLTQQSPCLPLATITDINGNPVSNVIGPLFGQLTTDATGRFTFGCTLGLNYQVQVAASASNTPAVNYPITCPGVGSSPQFNGNVTISSPGSLTVGAGANTSLTNLTVSGTGTFAKTNSIIWVDGITNATIAAAVSGAGVVNKTIIGIPSTYSGTECPVLQANLTFWDFRGGGAGGSPCQNNVQTYNGDDTQVNSTFRSIRTLSNPTDSSTNLYAQCFYSGTTVPAAQTIECLTGETDIVGNYASIPGTTNFSGSEHNLIWTSTGGTANNTYAAIFGQKTLGGSTTNITNAYNIRTVAFSKSGTGTITNAIGALFDNQTAGSTSNWAFESQGESRFDCSQAAQQCIHINANSSANRNTLRMTNTAVSGGDWLLGDGSCSAGTVGQFEICNINVSTNSFTAIKNTGTSFALLTFAPTAGRTYTFPDVTGIVGINLNATNGLYQSKRGVAGCTTAASIGGTCATDITVTWGTAFADANYSVTCTGSTPTAVPAAPFVVSGTKLAATVHINYFAITAVAASYATIDCIAVHD